MKLKAQRKTPKLKGSQNLASFFRSSGKKKNKRQVKKGIKRANIEESKNTN